MGVERGCKEPQVEHVVETVAVGNNNYDELDPDVSKFEGAKALDVVSGCKDSQIECVGKTDEVADNDHDEHFTNMQLSRARRPWMWRAVARNRW